LGTDARNQKSHFDGCTQRTFGGNGCTQGMGLIPDAHQGRYTHKAQHKYQNSSMFLKLPRNYTKVKVIVKSL